MSEKKIINNMKKYSIIIPLYVRNEDILNKFYDSLNSAVRQSTNNDFEIIVINTLISETEEYTSEINKICLCDPKVKIIHYNTIDISTKRNIGIDSAVGDYIVFLDGDDLLNENFLKQTDEILEQSNYDFIAYSNTYCKDELNGLVGINKSQIKIVQKKIFDNIFAKHFKNELRGIEFKAVWGKVFKRKIIKENNIKFNKNQFIGEDTIFVLEYSEFINEIYMLPTFISYFYRIDSGSTMQSYTANFDERIFYLINKYDNYIETYRKSYVYKHKLNAEITLMYSLELARLKYFHRSNELNFLKKYKGYKNFFKNDRVKIALKDTKMSDCFSSFRKLTFLLLKMHLYFLLSVVLNIRYNR